MRLLTVFPLLGIFAYALSATNPDEPIPEPILRSFSYSGNGCPQGTVNYTFTPVNSTLGLYSLAAFLPATMTPTPRVNFTVRNCALHVGIEPPSGYKFTANNRGVDVSGYMWLPDARRKFAALFNYNWSNDEGSPLTSDARLILPGPNPGRFAAHADVKETWPGRPGTSSSCHYESGSYSIVNMNLRTSVVSEVPEWPMYRPEVKPEEAGWIFTHSIDITRCPPWPEKRLAVKSISKVLDEGNAADSLSSTLSSSVSARQETSIPPVPTLDGVTYGGTGCPAGSITSTLTPVNSTLGTYNLTHTLPAMALNGSVLLQSRKNCQFNVKITLPKEWQYRINHDRFNVKGWLWLPDEKRKLTAKAHYYWSSDGYMSSSELQLKGPHSGRFAAWGEDPYEPGAISQCGGAMVNINTQARITSEVAEWPVYPGPETTPEEQVWTYTHSIKVVNERNCPRG